MAAPPLLELLLVEPPPLALLLLELPPLELLLLELPPLELLDALDPLDALEPLEPPEPPIVLDPPPLELDDDDDGATPVAVVVAPDCGETACAPLPLPPHACSAIPVARIKLATIGFRFIRGAMVLPV